uniref:GAF domain-containing protein n=1 Tax=Rhodosorus marinus TaxID=101924 RepID=A0A7S0BH83_9RHOD|mmetsp:Transcript_16327/g.23622  ORF Transcript_16327/g.23622 Transcript_16327/m.23622 type:complete len:278 (+) Transcript_16327:54-887(+)
MFAFQNVALLSSVGRSLTICSATDPKKNPGVVKKGFYIRPSKAIEKGGGFYVPGLRGWRLRASVGSLLIALLTANHISAGPNLPRDFLISELIAGLSATGVIASAAYTAWSEAEEEAAVKAAATSVDVEETGASMVASSNPSNFKNPKLVDEVEWAKTVLLDLTNASSIAVVVDDALRFHFGDTHGDDVGEVVRRVSAENKEIFIDDSSTLPPDVGFPFLNCDRVSAAVVPLVSGKGVLVVAGNVSTSPAAFDQKDRAWIKQVAVRLSSVLGVVMPK